MLSQIARIFRIPASLGSHLRSWNFRPGISAKLRPRPDESDDSDDNNAPAGDLGKALRGDAARRMEDTQQIQLLTQYPVSKKKQGFGCGHFHFHPPRKKCQGHVLLGGDPLRGHGLAVLLLHHRVEGVGVMSWGKLESFGSHPTRRQ